MRPGMKNGYLRGKERAIERESAPKNPSHFDSEKGSNSSTTLRVLFGIEEIIFVHTYTHVNITYKQQQRFADLRVYCRERERVITRLVRFRVYMVFSLVF